MGSSPIGHNTYEGERGAVNGVWSHCMQIMLLTCLLLCPLFNHTCYYDPHRINLVLQSNVYIIIFNAHFSSSTLCSLSDYVAKRGLTILAEGQACIIITNILELYIYMHGEFLLDQLNACLNLTGIK